MNNHLLAINLKEMYFWRSQGAKSLGESPGSLITGLLPNAIILAGVLTLILILAGGIGIIAGAGSGDPKSAAKGKAAITYGLIGFLIVAASYFILQIVSYTLLGTSGLTGGASS